MKRISVVVPCHNNRRSLPVILRSLAAAGVQGLEVICVDDASDQNLQHIARTFGAVYSRLPGDKPGRRAMARNVGHRLARGVITLYLDGDVIPEPRIITAALQIHAEHPRVAVKYPVYNVPRVDHEGELPVISSLIVLQDRVRLGPRVQISRCSDIRLLPRRLRGQRTALWMFCVSHCTSIPWTEVEAIGGWDENFLGWGEEDLELSYRLHQGGVEFLYPHPNHGVAYHLDHPRDWKAQFVSLDRNLRYFCSKHPASWECRRSLLRTFLETNCLPMIPAMTDEIGGQWHQAEGEEAGGALVSGMIGRGGVLSEPACGWSSNQQAGEESGLQSEEASRRDEAEREGTV